MTAPTDPARILAQEVAALRRDLIETQREVRHLIAAGKRQDDSHKELRRDVNAYARAWRGLPNDAPHTAGTATGVTLPANVIASDEPTLELLTERLGKLESKMEYLRLFGEFTRGQVKTLDLNILNIQDNSVWVEGFLRELELWVHQLAQRAFPKAYHFSYRELFDEFPKGFADVPAHRLPRPPKRKPELVASSDLSSEA